MLSVQFQNSVVAVGIVDASHMLVEAVIVCGSRKTGPGRTYDMSFTAVRSVAPPVARPV